MIGNLLLQFALWVVNLILAAIEFANMPAEIGETFADALAYIIDGFAFLNAYLDLTYIFSLIGIVVTARGMIAVYKLFFWVIRKIPFLNIRE